MSILLKSDSLSDHIQSYLTHVSSMKLFYKLSSLFLTSFISVSFALPFSQEQYTTISQWENCVATIQEDTVIYVCLPEIKPDPCPAQSWKALVKNKMLSKCKGFSSKGIGAQ